MAFIDEVQDLERKARLKKAAPVVGAGIAVLVLVVVLLALQGVFGGGGDFVIESASSGSDQAQTSNTGEAASGSAQSTSYASESSSQDESAGSVVVYVTGAVAKSGVYSFANGARVKDAVDAAGGFSKKADASSLNLARPLVDGEQIQVLTRKQAKQAAGTAGASAAASATTGSAASGASATGKVNINTASAEELKSLNGIGDATAQKIIAYREASGPFSKTEDLKNVSGIGDKKYAAIADMICV